MNDLSTEPRLEPTEYRHFRVVPRTPVIGGSIEGINLEQMTDEVAEDLREALWTYGVLFGKRQGLSFDAMKRVALAFGDRLEEHTFAPTLAEDGHPEVVVIERLEGDRSKSTTDIWHHDVTARKNPNIMSILQAEQVPFGADTMWSSMTAAYARLPEALRLMFTNLFIEHDSLYLMLRHDFGSASMTVEKMASLQETHAHPAVVKHHATGRPCLFVGNGYVKRVRGYVTEVSDLVIKIANEMPKIPEIQVRHQWEPGDFAIWDNFATAHYGVSADIGNQVRRLYRVASWSETVAPQPFCSSEGDSARA